MAADPLTPEPAFVPTGYDSDRCRSCGAVIFWAFVQDKWGDPAVDRYGEQRRMPVNAGITSDGDVITVPGGQVRRITAGEFVPVDRRFRSHHSTCPYTAEWRNRRRRKSAR